MCLLPLAVMHFVQGEVACIDLIEMFPIPYLEVLLHMGKCSEVFVIIIMKTMSITREGPIMLYVHG